MLYFAQCGDPVNYESFIVDAESLSDVVEWIKDFSSIDEEPQDEDQTYASAISGHLWYNIEQFGSRNEEHSDVLSQMNGIPLCIE